MNECIFCKIVEGKIPCYKVYEDGNILAFLDINPINKGHTLVVPKKHYTLFTDMPENVTTELFIAVKNISNAVLDGVEANGFNIMVSNNAAAGQVIPHVHIHIIPRFKNDGLKHWPGKRYKTGEVEQVLKSIKALI